ncbi:uncharacterized protein [Aegilops tauschii subsp. strangulata]|uniref:uncharacterized protein n=1 Tax=Aegilops tauschii subsp. strangulata TaxID=200361 RepID=UPI00098A043B|nr:uncharacterized protein LOC109776396 [Aegilops tauschii subsp. strangulata]
MIEAAKSILGGNKARSLYAIDVLRLEFYLADDSVSIGRAVADAMATGKVGLAEFTILTKKEIWQCSKWDLLAHGRQLRLLVGTYPSAFGGLARLKLQNLRLPDISDGLPKILSTCKRLEYLRLYNCDAGHMSLLQVEHPRLGELKIVDCDFERVELKWLPELALLIVSRWISPHDPVSFGHVPLFRSMSMANTCLTDHKVLSLSELLGEAAINQLRLDLQSEKVGEEECDLTWTMFILLGAPSLKELCITVRDHLCEMFTDPGERKNYSFSKEKKNKGLELDAQFASGFKHNKLAVLRIYGFQSEEKFISYIWSVMEHAYEYPDSSGKG